MFNVLVPWGKFFVGLGLIIGCFTTATAIGGMIMNYSFLMAGTGSHSPCGNFIEFLIITAGLNAGKFGLDPYMLPYLLSYLIKEKEKTVKIVLQHKEMINKSSPK